MNCTLLPKQRLNLSTLILTDGGYVYVRRVTLPNLPLPQELQNIPVVSGSAEEQQIWQRKKFRLTDTIAKVGFSDAARDHNYGNQATGFVKMFDLRANGLLQTISNITGRKCTLKVQLDNVQHPSYPNEGFDCIGEGVMSTHDNTHFGIVSSFKISSNNGLLVNDWYNEHTTLQAYVTVTLNIPLGAHTIEDNLCITKKILKDELACDITIIPKNGVPVKCHRNFLFAHSPVLEAMFGSSMKEGKTGTVEISDMEEQSVRAFLAYLYYWDVEEAQKSSLIAFELLNAGHKYDIPMLEKSMMNILLAKDNTWYDVDVALRLFLFSKNLAELDSLKMKAIQILKLKFSELEKSKCYQELFKKDSKAAMELCKYAFST